MREGLWEWGDQAELVCGVPVAHRAAGAAPQGGESAEVMC